MRRLGLVAVAVLAGAIAVWWASRSPEAQPERTTREAAEPRTESAKGVDDVRRADRAAAERARPSEWNAETDRVRWRALRDAVVRARDARVRRAASAAGAPVATNDDAVGTLDRDYIQAQMQEIKGLVQECYEDALRTEPSLEGRLVVEFVIGAEPDVGGIVEESHIDETSPLAHSAALSECVSESMYALELRAPEGGGRVTVRYPFVFRPTADAG